MGDESRRKMEIRALMRQIEKYGGWKKLKEIKDTELLNALGYELMEEYPMSAASAFVRSNDLEGLLKLAKECPNIVQVSVRNSNPIIIKSVADYFVETWPYGALELYTEIKDKEGIEKAKQKLTEKDFEGAFLTFIGNPNYDKIYREKFQDIGTAGRILEKLIENDEEVQYLLGDCGLYSTKKTPKKQCEDYRFRIKTLLPLVKIYNRREGYCDLETKEDIETRYPSTNLMKVLLFYSRMIDHIQEEHNLLTCGKCTKAYNKPEIAPVRTVALEPTMMWHGEVKEVGWVETTTYRCPECHDTMHSIKTLAKDGGTGE